MTHPNLARMTAALDRWEAEAAAMPPGRGATLLEDKSVWMNEQFNRLDRACAADKPAPEHLEGLTAWDLADARERLMASALRLRRGAHA